VGLRLAGRLSRRAVNSRREPPAKSPPTPPRREASLAAAGDQANGSPIAEIHSLSTAGRYGEALALAANELSRHPGDCELLFARASVLFDWGRMREAREGFLRAEAAGLSRTALYLNLAWSSHLLRLSEEAERYALKAAELDPSAVAAHFGLGTILQRLKHYPAAIASYERVLELAPDYADAAAAIAHCKLEQHEDVDAEAWMRRALVLAPKKAQFWINLGLALVNQERYAEAFEALRHAGDLESAQGAPAESSVALGLGLIVTDQNHVAVELYRRNLPDLPDPRAHGHYALSLLTLGRYREGWEQYEFRWLQEPHLSQRPNFLQPVWAGQPLAGKTILLLEEQGAGDIIQFARFAVPLKALGATVVLRVRPELLQLAQGFAGADRVFAPPTPPPPFDYYIHLLSIPHALGTELATIPAAVPYLRIDPVKLQRWAAGIDDGRLKVGIAWAGNPAHPRDRQRSIPLDTLSSLWELRALQYVSLQKPLRPGEAEKLPPQATLLNLGPDLEDLTDTAAAIAHLDLVICVDTAIAHLAGAMGKPVWLLLPRIGDFRWLTDRDDSPWYPTMRLFRQRREWAWDEVVARVKAALQEAVKTGSLTEQSNSPQSPAASALAANGMGTTAIQGATAGESKKIARVTETRYGIMQYVPDADRETRSVACYGEFLQPQLDLIARFVRPGAHVVESGSGYGAHALALAKMVGAEGQLFLYEPRPLVQRILLKNLQANRVAQSVTLMRRDLAGPQELSRAKGNATAGGEEAQASTGGEDPTETLDELLLERLDLFKIRSERVAAILEGASATLWRLRPTLFIATEDSTAATNLVARVKAFGYRCWSMRTPLFNPGNFNRRETDVFDGEAALALLAIPEEVEVAIALDGCVEMADRHDLPQSATKLTPAPA
jgi:tetratricopeptide (TPR) repeat protein